MKSSKLLCYVQIFYSFRNALNNHNFQPWHCPIANKKLVHMKKHVKWIRRYHSVKSIAFPKLVELTCLI